MALSLKSWLALWFIPDVDNRTEIGRRDRLLRMEFASFLQALVMIPAQVLKSGRQVVVRLLNINSWTDMFFRIVDQVRSVRHVRRE